MAKRPITQGRGVKPADVRVTQPTGHPDIAPRACLCGCGTMFTPLRDNHRFIEDHRFSTYETHSCPLCQGVHRVKVHHDSVGPDPRDSSLIDEAIEEQRDELPCVR